MTDPNVPHDPTQPFGVPPVAPPPAGPPQFPQYPQQPEYPQQPQYPQPVQYGAPPGFQPAAQPYQYGSGLPSGVNLATAGKRIVGYLIDAVILAVVFIPLWILLFASLGDSTTTTDQFGNTTSFNGSLGLGGIFMVTLATYAIQMLYHVGFVAVKGQTPGAMVMKVKVVRHADGQIPGWGPGFMRWVPNLVAVVPCIGSFLGLGLWIWALVNLFNNPLRQTPFDLAAKTVVIDVA